MKVGCSSSPKTWVAWEFPAAAMHIDFEHHQASHSAATHLNWLRLVANEGDINQCIRNQGLAVSPQMLRVRGGDQGFYSEFVRIIFIVIIQT